MGLFKVNPFKHHLTRWPIVMPLYDGRQCPMCSAVVLGWQAQRVHNDEHEARARWEEWAVETIYALAEKCGLELEPHPDGDEFGGRTPGKPPAKGGFVIGAGELPAEMRGGDD